MEPTNLPKILDVIQNHRALLDEFESFVKDGETEKAAIAIKGLLASMIFLDELVCDPETPLDPSTDVTNKVDVPQA